MARAHIGRGVTLALAVALLSVTPSLAAAGLTPVPSTPRIEPRPAMPFGPKGPMAPGATPETARLSDAAGAADAARLAGDPTVATAPCRDDESWLCGKVRVPFDRAAPTKRTIPIAFEIYPHQGSGPGLSDPVFITAGGPGDSATAGRYFFQYVVGPLLEERDLVLIDNRGTGKSRAINCRPLQSGARNHDQLVDRIGQCGRQLGDDADRYGTGDVAMDVEAVRKALGYPRINYYAGSYASVAAQAYAVRYPSRLRAVVIDAGMPVNDPEHRWTWGPHNPGALVRSTTLWCTRFPWCDAAQPDAGTAFSDLARAVAEKPVTGVARDQYGERRKVRVGQIQLGAIVWFGGALNSGEIAAAEDARRAGDPLPLLRLAAESPVWPGDSGDPRDFSFGNNAAAFCNDADFVWERTDPRAVRRQKYEQAIRDFPRDHFAPFTRGAWTTLYTSDWCLKWPAPDRFEPAVPPGATVRDVPVLLIVGDLDTDVPMENTEALLEVFPQATFVEVAGAGHTTVGWSGCAHEIVNRFLRTKAAGDTSCADEPSFVGEAVSHFFRTAAEAPSAAPRDGDASSPRQRKVVTSVVRTVQDAWLRSFRQDGAVVTGPGLRGGRFRADWASSGDHAIIRLFDARWTEDVAVSGRTTLQYGTNVMRMRIRVDGPGGRDGTLRARGGYGFGGPYKAFRVTGEIGGSPVHARVPVA